MIYCTLDTKQIFATIAVMLFVLLRTPALAADAPKPAAQVDSKRLIGHWERPDGGYILEINEILKEGKLKAAYYNPRPINVARAEFNTKEGTLSVFIELRDVNYPGSRYNLTYDPKSDKLIGTYFQAVLGQTYNVEFNRSK